MQLTEEELAKKDFLRAIGAVHVARIPTSEKGAMVIFDPTDERFHCSGWGHEVNIETILIRYTDHWPQA